MCYLNKLARNDEFLDVLCVVFLELCFDSFPRCEAFQYRSSRNSQRWHSHDRNSLPVVTICPFKPNNNKMMDGQHKGHPITPDPCILCWTTFEILNIYITSLCLTVLSRQWYINRAILDNFFFTLFCRWLWKFNMPPKQLSISLQQNFLILPQLNVQLNR